MNNKIIVGIVLCVLIIVAVSVFVFRPKNIEVPATGTGDDISIGDASSPQNATYTIDGHSVILLHGKSVVPIAPGSASSVTTTYFGNEVTHDFDGDGRPDVAFILTQNTGGSGTFYYVVIALNTVNGYVGSHGILLGDRITPQTMEMSKNPRTSQVIIVNYATRKAGESFTTPPSVAKSIWLLFDPKTMQFGEVAQNFEGEADPSKMSLGMKTWNWIDTVYNNDTKVIPKTANKFTIIFKNDKTFSVTTDCNSFSGGYSTNGNKLTINSAISTLMYCKGSQEQDFMKMLGESQSYMFTSKGELVLGLNYDSGSMLFR